MSEGLGDTEGELLVSWEPLAAPWVKYTVVVDGRDIARLGYRRPAMIPLAAGVHEVVLRHRKFHSQLVVVNVDPGGRVMLFGAFRTRRPGLNPRENWRWSKENSIWLGTEPVPPTVPVSFSASRLFFAVGGVVFFSLITARDISRRDMFWFVVAVVFVGLSLVTIVREVGLFWRGKRRPTH